MITMWLPLSRTLSTMSCNMVTPPKVDRIGLVDPIKMLRLNTSQATEVTFLKSNLRTYTARVSLKRPGKLSMESMRRALSTPRLPSSQLKIITNMLKIISDTSERI